jgi:3-dehydroquinate synthase
VSRTTVPVSLGPRSYDVIIGRGLLAELPGLLAGACPAPRYAIIADANVAARFGTTLRDALSRTVPTTLAPFPPGEMHKTRETWAALTDELLRAGLGRDGAVLALGGGVTGDLAGFVAATYHRGIPLVQVPTTLLAMVDSSVGGKTGVDTPAGKNLVGAFHQPRAVFADVDTLATLPRSQLAAGLAEALKHGAIADAGYFERLVATREALLHHDPEALTAAVARSVAIKAGIVARDERELGRRATLNFGHTVGHAVEAAADYRLLHGEAVAIGMRVEAALGVTLGVTAATDAARLGEALSRFGLPIAVPASLTTDRLVEAARQDKKSRAGALRVSLIHRLGTPARGDGEWTIPVDDGALRAAVDASR